MGLYALVGVGSLAYFLSFIHLSPLALAGTRLGFLGSCDTFPF